MFSRDFNILKQTQIKLESAQAQLGENKKKHDSLLTKLTEVEQEVSILKFTDKRQHDWGLMIRLGPK